MQENAARGAADPQGVPSDLLWQMPVKDPWCWMPAFRTGKERGLSDRAGHENGLSP